MLQTVPMLGITHHPHAIPGGIEESGYCDKVLTTAVIDASGNSKPTISSTFQSGFRVLEDRRPKPKKYVSSDFWKAINTNERSEFRSLTTRLRGNFNAIGLAAIEVSIENGISTGIA
jgi:hypothetical protein